MSTEAQKLAELKKQRLQRMKSNLPHLYSFKFYKWAREFFESRSRMNLLTAANQISKSSTQIRKCIHWATATELWPELWPGRRPRVFWYLYPSKDVSTAEFEEKWEAEFMPRNEMKDHPQYGWQVFYKAGFVHRIKFNTGVTVYFKHYSQDVHKLQSGTVDAMFTDEELPVELFDELNFRLEATKGYFHLVFTATKGQLFWYNAMEKRGTKHEVLKDARKWQISRYDCLEYEDGDTNTPWDLEGIEASKAKCSTEAEVLKRIMGRFVMDEGLKYPSFDRSANVVAPYMQKIFNEKWNVYSAVDIGSGGKNGHPAGIIFVAVRPDMKKGAVFRGWRGDGITTTSSDILARYQMLRGKLKPVAQKYDWAAADFFNYASNLGETFLKAEKSHELGEETLNTLFKNQMLDIFDEDEELEKLVEELLTLNKDTPKRKAKDDLIDALRYCVVDIPWDWTAAGETYKEYRPPKKELSAEEQEIEDRRNAFMGGKEEHDSLVDEINAYNELYDAY